MKYVAAILLLVMASACVPQVKPVTPKPTTTTTVLNPDCPWITNYKINCGPSTLPPNKPRS